MTFQKFSWLNCVIWFMSCFYPMRKNGTLFTFSWEVEVTYQNGGGKGLKSKRAVCDVSQKGKLQRHLLYFELKKVNTASFPDCVNSFKGHIYQWTSCTGSCVWTNVCGSEGWECRGALALEPCPFTGGGALPFICLSPWRPIGPRVPWPLGSVQYCHLILSFLLHNCFPHLRVWLFSFSLVPPFPLFHCPPRR